LHEYAFEDENELEFLFATIAKIMRERERERVFKLSFELESSRFSRDIFLSDIFDIISETKERPNDRNDRNNRKPSKL